MFAGKKNILLEDFPESQDSLTNDKVEEAFELMKEVVSVSAAARMKGKTKRRWPLDTAIICVEPTQKAKLETLSELLLSQLNVEKYDIIELKKSEGLDLVSSLLGAGLPVVPKVELERKKIGPKAKQEMGRLLDVFSHTDPNVIVDNLLKNGAYTFDLGNKKIELATEDFIIGYSEKEGFAMSKHDSLIVFISTTRNREMLARGLIRDIARRLQVLRKERGHNPTDVLEAAYILDLDEESLEMVREKQTDLSFLVRVKRVEFEDMNKNYKDEDLDGQKIRISVE
jgi:isoleucyl-tRNA synthetase